MSLCPCPVKGDSHISDSRLLDLIRNLRSDQGSIRTDGRFDTTVTGIGCKFPDVIPHQGLSAGEQQYRDSNVLTVIEKR